MPEFREVKMREEFSRSDREKILRRTCAVVEKQYFDPKFNGKDWPAMVGAGKQAILDAGEPSDFERAMHDLVRGLGTSHTGSFHQSVNRVPGRIGGKNRSEEHTSELQSRVDLVCRLLLEKKKKN